MKQEGGEGREGERRRRGWLGVRQEGEEGREGGEEEEGVAGCETGRRGRERGGEERGVEGKVQMEEGQADLVVTICPG